MPRSQSEEGISTQQTEERIRRLKLVAQTLQGIKGIVGLPIWQRRIYAARREPRYSVPPPAGP